MENEEFIKNTIIFCIKRYNIERDNYKKLLMCLLYQRYMLFNRILKLVKMTSNKPQMKQLYNPEVSNPSLFDLKITRPSNFQTKKLLQTPSENLSHNLSQKYIKRRNF